MAEYYLDEYVENMTKKEYEERFGVKWEEGE